MLKRSTELKGIAESVVFVITSDLSHYDLSASLSKFKGSLSKMFAYVVCLGKKKGMSTYPVTGCNVMCTMTIWGISLYTYINISLSLSVRKQCGTYYTQNIQSHWDECELKSPLCATDYWM